jgi:hypothetical protein
MPELEGTVKSLSRTGKGFILEEYESDNSGKDQWFNRGKDFEGAWPANKGDKVTVTYEQTFDADGSAKFWVREVWPTSQGRRTPPTGEQPKTGPVPTTTAGPTPTDTNGPKPASYDEYRAAGPVPPPPNRENTILFQTCLARAQEWVLATTAEGSPQRVSGEVLSVADTYYHEGLKQIAGEGEEPQDGDPGPGEPA